LQILIHLSAIRSIVVCEASGNDYEIAGRLRADGYYAKRVAPDMVLVSDREPLKFSKESK
jgi:hypothetical protein